MYVELKADRAKVHLDELERSIREIVDSKPYTIIREDDIEQGLHIVRLELTELPATPVMLVGEFAYCLRSGLDQLACQLAGFHVKRRPRSHTSFPIFGEKPAKGFGDSTRDIAPAAVEIIESLQPYHRRNAFRDHPLWILNKLCIIDKHLALPSGGTRGDIDIQGAKILFRRDFDYGVELAFPLADKLDLQFNPGPTEFIFGEPVWMDSPFQVRLADLRAIYDFVRNDVIPRFAGFFA